MKKWLVLLALTSVCVPLTATAKIDKSLRAELDAYVVKLSGETDVDTQQAVMLSNALLQGKKARKALETAKTSDDRGVRLGAGLALMSIGDRKAMSFVVKELATDGKLYDTLRERVSILDDKTELKLLEALLKEGKPETRRDVTRYLASQTGKLYARYEKFVTGKNEAIRDDAMNAAISRADTRVLKPAAKLAKNKDEKARNLALRLAIAVSERPSTRVDAIKFLKTFGQDKSLKLRETAARRLVELNDKSGTNTLLAMLSDIKDSAQRQDILRFLLDHDARAKLPQMKPFLGAKDPEEKALAHQLAATAQDAAFTKSLLEMERSTEFSDRIIGIRGLGWSGSDTAATILTRTLFEGRKDVRMASITGLAKLAPPSALPALEKSLRGEKDPEVKLAVIHAFGSFESKNAIRSLRFLVTNRDRKVRLAVVDSIRRIGLEDGAGALDVLLRDRDNEVQWEAFMTALVIKPKLGMSHLPKMMRNPSGDYLSDMAALQGNTRKQVFEYLLTKNTGSAQSNAIRWAMKDGGWNKTLAVLLAANDTASGDKRALAFYFVDNGDTLGMASVERQMRSAKEKPLRRLAAWLLVRNPNKNLEPTFRGTLGDKDSAIRAISVYGMARINK